MYGFHDSYVDFERMENIRQFLSTAATMDVMVDVISHNGEILAVQRAYKTAGQSIGFTQSLFCKVLTTQDNFSQSSL